MNSNKNFFSQIFFHLISRIFFHPQEKILTVIIFFSIFKKEKNKNSFFRNLTQRKLELLSLNLIVE